MNESAFLVSGIAERARQAGSPGGNFLRFEIPLAEDYVFSLPEQDKHHRWQLEGRQIGRYVLGNDLVRMSCGGNTVALRAELSTSLPFTTGLPYLC